MLARGSGAAWTLARAFPAASAPSVAVGGRFLASKKKDSKKDEDDGPSVDIDAEILKPLSSKGLKSMEILQSDLSQLRVGVASPSLLDSVTVTINEKRTPLARLAQVLVKDPQTLMVNVFDPTQTGVVSSSIQSAGLNLNPVVDKNAIRVPIPRPTTEYRDSMVKMVEKHAEKCRVSVRNLRQAALKDLNKHSKALPKDDVKRAEKAIQKIVDDRIKDVDTVAASKCKEINR